MFSWNVGARQASIHRSNTDEGVHAICLKVGEGGTHSLPVPMVGWLPSEEVTLVAKGGPDRQVFHPKGWETKHGSGRGPPTWSWF